MEHIDWKNRICGVVSDGNGKIALYRDVDGRRVRTQADFEPFLWATRNAAFDPAAATATPLAGADCAPLDTLLSFRDTAAYDAFLKARNKILPIQKLGCDENQFNQLIGGSGCMTPVVNTIAQKNMSAECALTKSKYAPCAFSSPIRPQPRA